MLESMRKHGRTWPVRILFFLLAGTFVLFYVERGSDSDGPGNGTDVLARVNGEKVTRAQVQGLVQQNLQRFNAFGGKDIPEQLQKILVQQAIQQLVNAQVVQQEVQEFPVGVSDQELAQEVMKLPFLQKNGRFDLEAFKRINRQNEFEREFRQSLAVQRYQDFLTQAPLVPAEDVEAEFYARETQANIDYLVFDPQVLKATFSIVPAELAAFENQEAERLKKDYDAKPEAYAIKEQVRARHLLLRLANDAKPEDEEKIQQKIQDLAQQAKRDPKAFATLAKTHSEDPGSKVKGGDLGYFSRGQMTPAFEDEAFRLAVGEVSPPIKTPFGYHILYVEDKKPARTIPFEEAKKTLARDRFLQERLDPYVKNLAETVNRRLQQGATVTDLVKSKNVAWQSAKNVSLRSPPFGPSPAARDLTRKALQLSDRQKTLDQPFSVDGKWYVLRFVSRKTASPAELTAKREQIEMDLRNQYGNRLMQEYTKYLRDHAKVHLTAEVKPDPKDPTANLLQ